MIKQEINDMSKKDQLKARAKDKMYNFILANGMIRGAILHATFMMKEMRDNHMLGILETLVLGHAYMGVSLMTSNLKHEDSIAFKIECEGPIRGLSVEANARGEVRGYLKNNPIPIHKPMDSFDLAPFFGTGYLEVSHFPEYAKQPYVGRIKLEYGRIAADLANYYKTSEQTPTSFNLSIKFDREGNAIGAGGLLLQALPNADEHLIAELEPLVQHLPSIGAAWAENPKPEDFILQHFNDFTPRILGDRRMEFFCRCQKETVSRLIAQMPLETLADMVKNGPFPLDSVCHNCNTNYSFSKEEIETLYSQKKEKDKNNTKK